MLLFISTSLFAGSFILSAGYAPQSDNPRTWVQQFDSQSNQYGIAYEGKRFGVSADYNIHGDDDRNSYITGYMLAHPFKYMIAGAGLMYADQPLRGTGQRRNFFAMLGVEDAKLFGNFGATLRFKHWSNGHIHEFSGWDGMPNPPRNVVSVGLVIPL